MTRRHLSAAAQSFHVDIDAQSLLTPTFSVFTFDARRLSLAFMTCENYLMALTLGSSVANRRLVMPSRIPDLLRGIGQYMKICGDRSVMNIIEGNANVTCHAHMAVLRALQRSIEALSANDEH